MISEWWSWLRQLVQREPMPAAPALERPAPIVLGLTVQEPIVAPVALRTLAFRGQTWQQQTPADGNGIVTFTREVAVNGRPVLSELRVREADLMPRGDTYHLYGRD